MLNKGNYETWIIKRKAVLIKTDTWIFFSGTKTKPELKQNYGKSKEDIDKWTEMNEKAKADIIQCISKK